MSSGYKRIDIKVDENGKVHIDTSGFVGDSCAKEAERLVALLQQAGLDVKTDKLELKAEYYAKAESGVKVKRQ